MSDKSASASYTLDCRRVSWAPKVDVNRFEVTTVLGVKSKKCWTRLSLGETSGKKWFDQCSKDGDRDGMKEAARNHKALDGVIKTLRWTLGEEGVDHPLD